MEKLYVNNTSIPQIHYDMWLQPHTLQPGESKILIVSDGVQGTSGIESIAPEGMYKVTNLYVNPVTGRTVVEYDNTPS